MSAHEAEGFGQVLEGGLSIHAAGVDQIVDHAAVMQDLGVNASSGQHLLQHILKVQTGIVPERRVTRQHAMQGQRHHHLSRLRRETRPTAQLLGDGLNHTERGSVGNPVHVLRRALPAAGHHLLECSH